MEKCPSNYISRLLQYLQRYRHKCQCLRWFEPDIHVARHRLKMQKKENSCWCSVEWTALMLYIKSFCMNVCLILRQQKTSIWNSHKNVTVKFSPSFGKDKDLWIETVLSLHISLPKNVATDLLIWVQMCLFSHHQRGLQTLIKKISMCCALKRDECLVIMIRAMFCNLHKDPCITSIRPSRLFILGGRNWALTSTPRLCNINIL